MSLILPFVTVSVAQQQQLAVPQRQKRKLNLFEWAMCDLVNYYGFDIVGCANRPVLEDARRLQCAIGILIPRPGLQDSPQ